MRILILFLVLPFYILSFAQTNTIKRLEEQRKVALLEISNTNKLLDATKKNTSSLLSRISLISTQIITRQKVLNLLESEIEAISSELVKNEREIVVLEEDLKNKQEKYATAIEAIIRNRNSENKLLFILSGQSLSESYRRVRYLKEYSAWRSNQADEIKTKREQLEEKKQNLNKTKAGKTALLKQRETENEKLKQEEETYKSEVKEAQQKQRELQKTLAQKKKQADALNKQIEKLIAEEIARQEKEAKRKEQARLEAEKKSNAKEPETPETTSAPSTTTTAGGIVITKEDFKLAGNFASNKGKLPFPVTGHTTITSRFGVHKHSQWVSTSANGIIIQAQPGAEARSVFEGEISRIFTIQGYNNNVLVRHGNYYTVYSNIQSLYVKIGDKVATGQAIGLIYTNPDTNVSESDFQLWQGMTKLDPEPWLKK